MQPSRDSSVWRSLAVAFGDGLAFGVGVKLTQAATARTADVVASPEPNIAPLAGRLEQFERRLAQMEQAPAALPPAPPPFDQKILEAVVNALDSRLREQASQVEQRLVELETKIAFELKALRHQDEAMAAAVEDHMEQLQDHFIGHVEAIRQRVEQDRADMRQEVASAVAAASQNSIEASLAPLRAEAAAKGREVAELRQRLEDGDEAMLGLLNGIGELIRHAAGRRGAPPAVAPIETAEPVAPTTDPASATSEAEQVADAEIDTSLPAFAQPGKPGRLWRVPLVSSMAIAACGVVVMHYL
jgi:hypothetical protein